MTEREIQIRQKKEQQQSASSGLSSIATASKAIFIAPAPIVSSDELERAKLAQQSLTDIARLSTQIAEQEENVAQVLEREMEHAEIEDTNDVYSFTGAGAVLAEQKPYTPPLSGCSCPEDKDMPCVCGPTNRDDPFFKAAPKPFPSQFDEQEKKELEEKTAKKKKLSKAIKIASVVFVGLVIAIIIVNHIKK